MRKSEIKREFLFIVEVLLFVLVLFADAVEDDFSCIFCMSDMLRKIDDENLYLRFFMLKEIMMRILEFCS